MSRREKTQTLVKLRLKPKHTRVLYKTEFQLSSGGLLSDRSESIKLSIINDGSQETKERSRFEDTLVVELQVKDREKQLLTLQKQSLDGIKNEVTCLKINKKNTGEIYSFPRNTMSKTW